MSLRRSAAAVATALVLALMTACSGTSETQPTPKPSSTPAVPSELRAFYGQDLKWVDCGGSQCTTVKVPLDYSKPADGAISLAVTRIAATGESLGALFVNPGGPGGSGFDYAKSASVSLSKAITEHFDVIGVDPRGVSKSDPVNCLTDEERDEVAAVDFTSDSPQDQASLIKAGRLPARGCQATADPEFKFMDTTSVAKDFDIVRHLVGDPSFNYLGKSYGTAIGTDYAELFPQRVGRMVLDGVLPTELGLEEITGGQAVGFEDAFMHFAEDCASKDNCPYRGTTQEVAAKIRDFLVSLESEPLPVGDRMLNSSLATSAVLSFLYFPARDYPRLREALDAAVNARNGEPLFTLLDERSGRQADGRYIDNATDAFYAVTCLDRQYSATVAHIDELATRWMGMSPTFGAGLAWGLFPCANWPAKGTGPATSVNIEGTAPILIVSTTHDPATPGIWGKDLAKKIPNSGLLTWDAYNHTAYQQGSSCVDEVVDSYLLRGTMPSANAVC